MLEYVVMSFFLLCYKRLNICEITPFFLSCVRYTCDSIDLLAGTKKKKKTKQTRNWVKEKEKGERKKKKKREAVGFLEIKSIKCS